MGSGERKQPGSQSLSAELSEELGLAGRGLGASLGGVGLGLCLVGQL